MHKKKGNTQLWKSIRVEDTTREFNREKHKIRIKQEKSRGGRNKEKVKSRVSEIR